ncbi:unnamed protein product [Dovyalis caffra]|uniref:Uncharacterized protein n=1 Tax=Dovyalis caffra TaxID=77055 RepID=A0AAV1RAF5_9ROSI|nr:unnamed protein product [Dovyalis caffra]
MMFRLIDRHGNEFQRCFMALGVGDFHGATVGFDEVDGGWRCKWISGEKEREKRCSSQRIRVDWWKRWGGFGRVLMEMAVGEVRDGW